MSRFRALDIALGVLILVALGTVLALAFIVPAGTGATRVAESSASASPDSSSSDAASASPLATAEPSSANDAAAASPEASASAAAAVPTESASPEASTQASPQPEASPSASPAKVALGQTKAAANEQSIDDGLIGVGLNEFRYTGGWEHLANRSDGRTLGTSSRSFRKGDRVSISFVGSHVRLYGICGPGGGYADISIDGRRQRKRADFYAPTFSTQSIVYESPELGEGVHTLTITVAGNHNAPSHGNYVNIDRVVISERG